MKTFAKLQGIKAVAFDVFGTLVEITEKRRPYRQLLQAMESLGRTPKPDDGATLMSHNVGLAGVGTLFGVDVPASTIASLELELYAELPSIRIFPEVNECLTELRNAGYKIGLCSNLSAPYAVPVKLLLPFELDWCAWSFEVGAIKPQRKIFDNLCAGLGYAPHEIMMVGDTFEADYTGPRELGMRAMFLARDGNAKLSDSVQTLDQLLT